MERIIREQKINLLKSGFSAYAESAELIRLIKRDIFKYSLNIAFEETSSGCWFIPLPPNESSQSVQ